MSAINFRKKISFSRPYNSRKEPEGEYYITRHFESDRGRIINSAAIRRLQQKTQVFPLERNAAVRSRLTHSLEVQQTGRYITKEILQTLKMQGGLAQYGLDELEGAFESLIEMMSVIHLLAILARRRLTTGLKRTSLPSWLIRWWPAWKEKHSVKPLINSTP
jgi:dGTPase